MAELAGKAIEIADTERPKKFQGRRVTELTKTGSPQRDGLRQCPKPIKPWLPAVQMGPVSKRGPDFGTPMLTSFIESRQRRSENLLRRRG